MAPVGTGVVGFSLVFKGVFSYAPENVRVDISSVGTGYGNAVVYRYIPFSLCRSFASYMLIAYKNRRITCIYRVVTS